MAASTPSPTSGSGRPARHGAFHPLTVAAVDRLTDDSVALTLRVPEELRGEYLHAPGQHLTLRRSTPEGVEIRRTYSICSPPRTPRAPARRRCGWACGWWRAASSPRSRTRRSPPGTCWT